MDDASQAPGLRSFGQGLKVAVIGAYGGLGGALVEAFTALPQVTSVEALGRHQPQWASEKVKGRLLDLEDEASVTRCADDIRADHILLDIVFVASGVLHRVGEFRPERRYSEIDPQAMAKVFSINTIGPALAAKHFIPLMPRDRRTVFAAISARVGSISDNGLGGWYSYRASKAALNMLVKTLSIEAARRNPEAVCLALHPGTVATGLSAPFAANLPEGRVMTPQASAHALMRVIDGCRPEQSGDLIAWDGQRIAY